MRGDDGGPTFPIPHQILDFNDPMFKPGSGEGMTLRDYYLGQAMIGILACPDMDRIEKELHRSNFSAWADAVAKSAGEYADAAVREKRRFDREGAIG